MNVENLALENNKNWIVIDLPLGKKAIGCKWVYMMKYKANGNVERYTTCLEVKGFTQEGIDYIETSSTIAKMTIAQYFLALAASQN